MTTPRRIQMSRQHPWRVAHPDAVIVARPSRWGNPWRVARSDDQWAIVTLDPEIGDYTVEYADTRDAARASAVAIFRAVLTTPFTADERSPYPSDNEIRTALRGHDLACWCKTSDPCHADVLLEIANGGER